MEKTLREKKLWSKVQNHYLIHISLLFSVIKKFYQNLIYYRLLGAHMVYWMTKLLWLKKGVNNTLFGQHDGLLLFFCPQGFFVKKFCPFNKKVGHCWFRCFKNFDSTNFFISHGASYCMLPIPIIHYHIRRNTYRAHIQQGQVHFSCLIIK